MVAIYWINHHHIFHLVRKVDNLILWSNIFLLFCVSLIPFSTAYMGENHMTPFSVSLYLGVLLICACSFLLLLSAITRYMTGSNDLARLKRRLIRKNMLALVIYVIAAFLSYVHPAISLSLALVVAVMYFLPDALVEKRRGS